MLYEFQVYSKVNQLYIYVYPLFFRFFSHVGNYRALSRVPCAIQQVLISCLFYIQQCVYVTPSLPIHPLPPRNHRFVFYVCDYFCLVNKFICTIFLDSTYKQYHIFVFLCLTYFTQYDSLQVHPRCCRWGELLLTKSARVVIQALQQCLCISL